MCNLIYNCSCERTDESENWIFGFCSILSTIWEPSKTITKLWYYSSVVWICAEVQGAQYTVYSDAYLAVYSDAYLAVYSDAYSAVYSDAYLAIYSDTYLAVYSDAYLAVYSDAYDNACFDDSLLTLEI